MNKCVEPSHERNPRHSRRSKELCKERYILKLLRRQIQAQEVVDLDQFPNNVLLQVLVEDKEHVLVILLIPRLAKVVGVGSVEHCKYRTDVRVRR